MSPLASNAMPPILPGVLGGLGGVGNSVIATCDPNVICPILSVLNSVNQIAPSGPFRIENGAAFEVGVGSSMRVGSVPEIVLLPPLTTKVSGPLAPVKVLPCVEPMMI